MIAANAVGAQGLSCERTRRNKEGSPPYKRGAFVTFMKKNR